MAKAKKPAVSKSKKSEQPKPAAPAQPLVDTSAAAESAARLLLGKVKLGDASASADGDTGRESAAFKQLKQSAKGPGASGVAKSLGQSLAPKNTLPTRAQQSFHAQTHGFATRVNVPRRTGG